jgi:hypothetical protein
MDSPSERSKGVWLISAKEETNHKNSKERKRKKNKPENNKSQLSYIYKPITKNITKLMLNLLKSKE